LQFYSIVSSAHRHHLTIDDYLDDVLRKLADARQNHPADLKPGTPYLADLLPDRWALAYPRSLREGRAEMGDFVPLIPQPNVAQTSPKISPGERLP
jgi:hypothetical protein